MRGCCWEVVFLRLGWEKLLWRWPHSDLEAQELQAVLTMLMLRRLSIFLESNGLELDRNQNISDRRTLSASGVALIKQRRESTFPAILP